MDYTFTRTELFDLSTYQRAIATGTPIIPPPEMKRALLKLEHALEGARTGYPATIKREG